MLSEPASARNAAPWPAFRPPAALCASVFSGAERVDSARRKREDSWAWTSWSANWSKSWDDAVRLCFGSLSKFMFALLIGVIGYLIAERCREKGAAKKHIENVLWGLLATVIAFLVVLFFHFIFLSPVRIYKEQQANILALRAATNTFQMQLNSKPTPIRTKYLNLSNQLIERADGGEKMRADGKWNSYSFLEGVLDEFQSRIERGRIELAEHGQRSDKLNELAMWLEINHLMQLPPSVLDDMAKEMKRMAERLNE